MASSCTLLISISFALPQQFIDLMGNLVMEYHKVGEVLPENKAEVGVLGRWV